MFPRQVRLPFHDDVVYRMAGIACDLGERKNDTGPAGIDSGERDTDKWVADVDLCGDIRGKTYWYFRYLWNTWGDFLDQGKDCNWWGAFAGVDHILNERWALSGTALEPRRCGTLSAVRGGACSHRIRPCEV